MHWFEVDNKPKNSSQVRKYLVNRVTGTGIARFQDQPDLFCNAVVKSPNTEEIFGVPTHPTMLISARGAMLLRGNSGLRGVLKSPSLSEQSMVGEGSEGLVVALPNLTTDQEEVKYVVKYAFPTSSDRRTQFSDRVAFTPGVDAMRVVQWFLSTGDELPKRYKRIKILPIEIATIDISVSPLIPFSIPLDLLTLRSSKPDEHLDDYLKMIAQNNQFQFNEQALELTRAIYDYDTELNDKERFLSLILRYSVLSTAGLTQWLTSQYTNGLPFSFITPEGTKRSFKETEIPRNKLVDLTKLITLWRSWKEDKDFKELYFSAEQNKQIDLYLANIQNGDTSCLKLVEAIFADLTERQIQFLEAVVDTFTVLELMQSYYPR